jgi:hypothetical protein
MALNLIMARLVPAIHVFSCRGKTWIPGIKPGMTEVKAEQTSD